MKVEVKLFARARDVAGSAIEGIAHDDVADSIPIEVARIRHGATVVGCAEAGKWGRASGLCDREASSHTV